jgi:hypothetical protein
MNFKEKKKKKKKRERVVIAKSDNLWPYMSPP